MDQIANVIIWVVIVQGIFLGLAYIFSRKSKSKANKILGFFLLAFVLEALSSEFIPYNYIGTYVMGDYFGVPEVKLFFPALFLHYILEKLDRVSAYKNYLKTNYLLAISIFCLTPLNIIMHFTMHSSISIFLTPQTADVIFMTSQYAAFVLSVLAFIIAIAETLRYKKMIQNEFTDYGMLQINWLWQFIFILLPVILLWGIELGHIILEGSGPTGFTSITWFFVFIFLYFFSFKAFRNPNLFEQVPQKVKKEIGMADLEIKKSLCSEENSSKIIESMEKQEFYLDEELTLHSFAKEINMSSRLISSCLNNSMGYNFNEWVNNFRVERALQIIKSDQKNTLSIEGIGSDSGFKSRSAMYAAFNKKLGHSPGHFRKN